MKRFTDSIQLCMVSVLFAAMYVHTMIRTMQSLLLSLRHSSSNLACGVFVWYHSSITLKHRYVLVHQCFFGCL
jgi:hypothetical protein